MEIIPQIPASFIEEKTSFKELILVLKKAFETRKTLVPLRHHHEFPNPKVNADSTLLLMPAWNSSEDAGVKIYTVSPKNEQFGLPSGNGTYIYIDALKGTIKAILEAKSLTSKRTAATSALASSYLSKKDASSLLMIGTGALSTNLIKAHAAVRPIKKVYVWGRNFSKAEGICNELKNESFKILAIKNIGDKISEVDIISCATLSETPLVLGKDLRNGQHIDLVGAYKTDMRESDDKTILKSSIFIDTFEAGLNGSGDIFIPLEKGIIKESDIKADLFELCSSKKVGRTSDQEITLFKSVGHALEDLAAAKYYYKQYRNA